MKKAVLIILALVVLAVGGVSAYVAMIDWNEHKDKIAEQISDVSGKLVAFEGPVSFKIFPTPDLIASNIKVYSNEAGHQDTPLATIDKLVAKLDLWALLKGNFEVKMMSLVNPKIFMEVDNNGRLNWQSSITEEQKLSLDNIEITLDSVLLEKATLNFVNTKHDIDITLENLNAEVIAPSIFGPYRIEGSYIKDNNPEGFALSLGRFSESFATSVNFVLNHPTSETFVRFDGSVLLKNDAINGDVIIESKKPVDFLNKNFKELQLGAEYDYPFALSLQADTNKTKIALSNIVVKYGSTAGAGNILVPLDPDYVVDDDTSKRRRAEIGFEMTDLDLAPVEAALKSAFQKYSAEGAIYNPQLKFDFIADLKAINTLYKGQTLKNFNLSVDYLDNELKIRNLSASLPGDTEFKLSGDVFSDNDVLTYSLDLEYTTNDLQKLLAWLGYEVNPITQATYKRSAGDATVEGTLKTVKIAPFDVSIDKSAFSGSLGIIIGERMNAFMEVQADSVNFDNYIPSLPDTEKEKSMTDRINYRISKLGFLNDFDFRLIGSLGLGIYEGVPFENSQFDMDVAQGLLTISKLEIGSMANASVNVTGKLTGLGKALQFENLKYELETRDFVSFLNKFALPLPDINLKKLKNFNSKGIVSGTPTLMAMKAVSKLEYLDFVFGGQAGKRNEKWVLSGNVDVRAPDFVQMVNDFNFNYKPKTFSLGLFTLTGKLAGMSDYVSLTDANVFVGSNNFKGNVVVDKRLARPNIKAELDINKFELDRFVYNNVSNAVNNAVVFRNNDTENADFIARPKLDKDKINYDFYKTFDLSGNIKVGSLSYKAEDFKKAAFAASLKEGVFTLKDFSAEYNGGNVNGSLELAFVETPQLKGNLNFKNQNMAERVWSGKKYGIKSGTLDAQVSFATNAESEEDLLNGLNAEILYDITSPNVKGWNLAAIAKDLRQREYSEGLATLATENLQQGETLFQKASGKVKIANADYVFENALFEAPGWRLDMTDKGNLNLWDMDAQFVFNISDSKVKPLKFALAGAMMAPELSVDVKDITDIYDAHWAKVASDKKAAEDARKAYLKSLMDTQQNYAKSIQKRLFEEFIPELEAKRKLTQNPEILAKYQEIDDRMKEISKGLDEVIVQGTVPEFDESLPKALSEKNTILDEKSAGFKKEILAVYALDVKQRIKEIYNKITDNYNQSKEDVSKYRDGYGVFAQRLAMIKTMLDIEQDDKVIALKKEIEDELLAIDAINSQVVKDYIFIQNSQDLEQLENYADKISDLEKQTEEDLKQLNDKIDELFKYSEEITKAEEKAHEERLKQEEIKKKLEENTGKISRVGGKDIMVTRNIQEIEAMEKAKENEDIPVLDFSGKQPSGIVTKPNVTLETQESDDDKVWNEIEAVGRKLPEVLQEETKEVVNETTNGLSEQEEILEPEKLENKAEDKPLLVPSGSLLKETMGEITKASGKIIRVED